MTSTDIQDTEAVRAAAVANGIARDGLRKDLAQQLANGLEVTYLVHPLRRLAAQETCANLWELALGTGRWQAPLERALQILGAEDRPSEREISEGARHGARIWLRAARRAMLGDLFNWPHESNPLADALWSI